MHDSQSLFPESPSPAGVKTSPTLETRDTVFLFLFFFLPRRFQEVKQELQLFLRSWLVCYPDPDLMFRLAVTSCDLEYVTHAEDRQTGSRARGECGDMKQTFSVCVCLLLCSVLLIQPSPVYTPTSLSF